MKVKQGSIPHEGLIASALGRIDYQDDFAVQVNSKREVKPAEVVQLFFPSFPKWFMALVYTREQIARWIAKK